VADAHAAEHARFEEALRDRAHTIRGLEAELHRRDRMVRELVDTVQEAEGQMVRVSPDDRGLSGHTEAAPPRSAAASAQAEVSSALEEENARLRERLDALALELARREGEAQASAWAVAELERRLAEVVVPPTVEQSPPADAVPDVAPPSRLKDALDELDALRQALAQEHALRVRVESGEELAQARAEIQRQATLLEQLGHASRVGDTELDAHGK
jgi:hypothetical protein